jgi:hypothetical protein
MLRNPSTAAILLRAAVAATAFGIAATAAADPLLAVELRTDYLPYEDFILVRVRTERLSGDPRFRQEDHVAFIGERFLESVRVADIDLPGTGDYRVRLDLIDGRGDLLERHLRLFTATHNHVMTFLVAKQPAGSAEKTFELRTDADGDGLVGAGDVLRYSVVLQGNGGDSFSDRLRPGTRLVAGSVTATRGEVTRGNAAGDTTVEVARLGLTASESATITFDAEVVPAVENQGRFFAARVVAGLGRMATRTVPTDDPTTERFGDPTVTPVFCASTACTEDLATCRRELGGLTGDPDGDGVPNVLDLCPKTAKGEAVDARGCALAQFCADIDAAAKGGEVCRSADWRGDEPTLRHPRDCAPATGVCQAE